MTSDGKRKVVVTQRFFDDATIAYLHANDLDVIVQELPKGRADGDVPQETLLEWLDGASGWIVGHARVSRELLSALPRLEVIARRGVGYDRVDTKAVSDLGRVATIAAGANDAAVADQTVGMMLALGRRFREGQANVVAGSWSIPLGNDLYRKTVGVIGLGRIGRSVLRRLRGFDCRLLVSSKTEDQKLADALGFEYASVETLLAQSDYVTIHAPLTDQTRFLIREETIGLMKPSAFLINTARGGLVEDRDLLNALKSQRLAGVALDVFCSEADPRYAEVTRELASLPNVIALPHAGASTHECLERTNRLAAECIVAVLNGREAPAGCAIADGRTGAAALRTMPVPAA